MAAYRVLSAPVVAILVLSAQLLPSLPFYLGIVGSMALGTTIAATIILFFCWMHDLYSRRLWTHPAAIVSPGILLVVLASSAFALLHAAVADFFVAVDISRLIASLLPLALILGGGAALGKALSMLSHAQSDFVFRTSFWVLFCVMLLSFTPLQPRADVFGKATFPFTETSHFGLAFGPVLMYRARAAAPRTRTWWVLLSFLIAVLVQSMVLMAAALLIAAACRRLLLLTQMAIPLLLVALPLGLLEYFSMRLVFTGDDMNLSTLVYVQGWQQLWESLSWTSGWGVGFQQLGVHGSEAAASELIRKLTVGTDLNLLDGSFVLAKLGGEFGVPGLMICLALLAIATRCVVALRGRDADALTTFARSVVIIYTIDILVRGTGYFTQSSLMLVAALAALLVHGKAWWPGATHHTVLPSGSN